MHPPAVVFCATGRTGLGHLRRTANIAVELSREPAPKPALLSNADPDGLAPEERAVFAWVARCPRPEMASRLSAARPAGVVVDTASVPGLHRVDAPLCLVLRRVRSSRLSEFRLDGERPWDLILVPHPEDEWTPETGLLPARSIRSVGWIHRNGACGPSSPAMATPPRPPRPQVLVASGGGGEPEGVFPREAGRVLRELRRILGEDVEVVQALGPRVREGTVLEEADRTVHPGPELPRYFEEADLVLSTAGYNSVLELAVRPVPVVLVPVPRTYDDQEERAEHWGPRLGWRHREGKAGDTAAWMAERLAGRERRDPVRIGPSGAGLAARCIRDLVA